MLLQTVQQRSDETKTLMLLAGMILAAGIIPVLVYLVGQRIREKMKHRRR